MSIFIEMGFLDWFISSKDDVSDPATDVTYREHNDKTLPDELKNIGKFDKKYFNENKLELHKDQYRYISQREYTIIMSDSKLEKKYQTQLVTDGAVSCIIFAGYIYVNTECKYAFLGHFDSNIELLKEKQYTDIKGSLFEKLKNNEVFIPLENRNPVGVSDYNKIKIAISKIISSVNEKSDVKIYYMTYGGFTMYPDNFLKYAVRDVFNQLSTSFTIVDLGHSYYHKDTENDAYQLAVDLNTPLKFHINFDKPDGNRYSHIFDLDERPGKGYIFVEQSGGTLMHIKKTNVKKTLLGRVRTVYVGKYGKQYVKVLDKYVAVKDIIGDDLKRKP